MDSGLEHAASEVLGRRAASAVRVPKSASARPTHVNFASQQRSEVFFGLHSWLVDHVFAFEEPGRVVFDVATDSRIDLKELLRSVVVAPKANVFLTAVGSLKALAPKGAFNGLGHVINTGLPLVSVRGAERMPLLEVTTSPSW